MASLTVENYVKTIYVIALRSGEPASTGQIADALGVAPGTVTSMLKTLDATNLATYTPYEGVQLTEAGRVLALRVLRRHRLVELFLERTLELTWDEVHEEAENMEHAVSDWLVDRIDAYLAYPQVDPHGDPIPQADGTVHPPSGRRLAACEAGQRFRVARVLDQSPEFLRYLAQVGLNIGATGTLLSKQSQAGVCRVDVDGIEITLGSEAADKLFVEIRD